MKLKILLVSFIILLVLVLTIWSDSLDVELMGVFDTCSYGVYTVGEYAYVCTLTLSSPSNVPGLSIVDISSPANPQEIGFCSIPDYALDVYVIEDYAYVVASDAGLRVINVSDPTNPYEIGFCDTFCDSSDPMNTTWAIYVAGNYAYVSAWNAGLRIIDISNPSNPYEVGFHDTPGNVFGIYVLGNYAYLADRWGGFRVVDVSNPEAPYELGFCQTPDDARSVYVLGNHAYVATRNAGLRIIDVSNPTNPYEIGFCNIAPGKYSIANDIYVAGGYAYIADYYNGLRVINVSDPIHPQEVGFFYIEGTTSESPRLHFDSDYIYLAYGCSALLILRYTSIPTPGILSGTITDSSTGDPIVAQVQIAGPVNIQLSGTSFQHSVPEGAYDVTASSTEYITQTQDNIVVNSGETTTVNFSLMPDYLKRYAPILYFHTDEQFYPWGIESMLDKAELREWIIGGAYSYKIADMPVVTEQFSSSNTLKSYLDLKDYNAIDNPPTAEVWENYNKYSIYGRSFEPPSDTDKILLQYWIFYPFNSFIVNAHEGDWEMIQIRYSRSKGEPDQVTTSHHHSGTRVHWGLVDKVGQKHPKIYVAKGSHGNWPNNGEDGSHDLSVKICDHFINDKTGENGLVLYPEILADADKEHYELVNITVGHSWKYWLGAWGESWSPLLAGIGYRLPGSVGPRGPGNQGEKWDNPIEWGDHPLAGLEYACLGSPANLHVYDSSGNHVGLTQAGEIEATIPGTYFYIPSSHSENSKDIVWINTSDDLRFVIEATAVGSFFFNFGRYTGESNLSISATYEDIQITADTVATVDVSPDNPDFIMEVDLDGDGIVDEIQYPTEATNTWPLELGWDLISLPLQPENTEVTAVLSSIEGKYDSIWRYDSNPGWRWYLPNAPEISNLWEMESGIGYWIETTEACSLTIQGTQPQTAIPLSEGWNLVGYGSQTSDDIEDCMTSIAGLYISVWEYDAVDGWQWYMSASPDGSNLDSMRPGFGYWIESLTACIWDIGGGAPLAPPSIPVSRKRYIPSQKPDIPYVIWGNVEVNNVKVTGATRDAPVVLLKVNGEVVSSCQLGAVSQHGDSYALDVPVSVDDSAQAELYVQMDGQEVKADMVPPGRPGQVMRFDLSVEFRPKVSQLHQNFPNPFNPETWIPYQLKEDAHVEVRIYALTGQLVRTLSLGHKPAGFYVDRQKAAYWDGRSESGEKVSSGVYFYKIQAGDECTATKKMVIVR